MKKSLFLLLMVALVLVGCRQEAAAPEDADIDIDLTVDPAPPVVGDATVSVMLMQDEEPITDATVEVRGDMTHAGMQPILRTIESGEDGLYQTDFEWTMAGDWIVTVSATLADGTVVSEDFEYTLDGEMDMTDEEMSDMDHDMDSMDMSGSTTGGYMQLTNEGEETDTLVGVSVDFADMVEIHETRIEDDMASMVEIGRVEIPAGDTASLEPAGMHIMFMSLTRDLMPGDTVELTLSFESGAEATVVAIVQDEAPEAGEAANAGDIVIGGAWVRPALAGDASDEEMSDMDMGDDEMDMSEVSSSEDATEEGMEEMEDMDMEATPTAES